MGAEGKETIEEAVDRALALQCGVEFFRRRDAEDRQRRTRDELHLALRPGGGRHAGERDSPQSPQDLADGRLVTGCLPAGDGPEEDSDLVLRTQYQRFGGEQIEHGAQGEEL